MKKMHLVYNSRFQFKVQVFFPLLVQFIGEFLESIASQLKYKVLNIDIDILLLLAFVWYISLIWFCFGFGLGLRRRLILKWFSISTDLNQVQLNLRYVVTPEGGWGFDFWHPCSNIYCLGRGLPIRNSLGVIVPVLWVEDGILAGAEPLLWAEQLKLYNGKQKHNFFLKRFSIV